jgi:apolipoprotein N-acyltransferase
VNPTALAHRVILAWGWPRRLIAFVAGAVGALAMAPLNVLPALAVAMTAAVWLIDGAAGSDKDGRLSSIRAAAATGWWFGFGYFVAGLWWLGAAFLVEADEFAWALPLGVVALPAGLALFTALGFALARLLWQRNAMRIVALAVGLSASEWLRGHLFTGFPWNSFGMALGGTVSLAQIAAYVGLYGLTFIAVLLAASFATLGTGDTTRARLTAPVLALVALAGLAVFGTLRVPSQPVAEVAGVKLRLMQPNVPQDAKFRPENRDRIMRHYLTLSDRATSPLSTGVSDITHLVWPESAFPFLLARDPPALAQIAALLPAGTTLVTGAARAGEPLPGEVNARYFNAIQVVADDGTLLSTYDKVHLVPFGEYLPFSGLLREWGLRQFVRAPAGFEAGPQGQLLTIRGLPPAAPLICYEAIFPAKVVAPGTRPGLLLNLTNDAWFGLTPGPYQHLAQARLRTIEEGLPLVRVANTGISAVVDPYGRTIASLPLGIEGVLDTLLPRPIATPFYAQMGDLTFFVALGFFFVVLLVSRRMAPLG